MQEDDLTTYKLLAAGWHSIYVPCAVQWGLGPDTFAGYLQQSKRWAVGLIQVNLRLSESWTKGLAQVDRILFVLWDAVIGSAAFLWTFICVALPLLVSSGARLIITERKENLVGLMRVSSANYIAQSL